VSRCAACGRRFDLAAVDLPGLWFQLQIETHTTDFVLREVKQEIQWQRVSPFVDAKLLQVHARTAQEIGAVAVFAQTHTVSACRMLRACCLPDGCGHGGPSRNDAVQKCHRWRGDWV